MALLVSPIVIQKHTTVIHLLKPVYHTTRIGPDQKCRRDSNVSCGATEAAAILTAVNSLTPLASPYENAISPRRETDYPKTKDSRRGFVKGHLREGRGHNFNSVQHMEIPLKLCRCHLCLCLLVIERI